MTYPAGATRAFQYGLGIFALTALLGLTNATKIFGDIDRNTLLTHLHSGTLGWITMGVFGIAIALFGGNGTTIARNVLLSALATAAYVLAFWSGNFYARAIFGAIELAVIVGWWWWVVQRTTSEGYGRVSNPKLSVVLGLTTLVIGSTLGVIVQILYATNNLNEQNSVLIGAHASAQVGGYLILVAAGVAEWILNPGGGRTGGGALLTLLAERPRVWPWADHVIFWGLNVGAASFIAVLIFVGTSAGSAAFSHPVAFTAPIMGLSALLAIVTYEMRLAGAPATMREPAPA